MSSYFEKREFTREKPLDAWACASFGFRAHWQQDVELVYVLEGMQGLTVDDRHAVLSAGDLAVCRSRSVHIYDASPGDGRVVVVIADAGFLRDQTGWSDRFVLKTPFLHRPELEPLFRALAEEGASRGPHHAVAMKAALLSVFAALLRTPDLVAASTAGPAPAGTNLSVAQRALAHLEDHYAEDLTHETLAAHLGLSPSYFSRVFHRATGMGFRAYLNHLRVEQAVEMLADPSRSVTEIAYACGFGSLRTFHRAFRDVTGRTPLGRREGPAGPEVA
jgi:AraC-like DNA-binding protein